ncbi:transposase of Transposase, IS30 family domain protein [Acinetobacter baumannii 655555]|nr:transposase of Transposase, IS30 family domain protein [Acinetobacter baumannii 655555]
MSYHHLNFEDRTALMLESRKEGFSARKFAELIKSKRPLNPIPIF